MFMLWLRLLGLELYTLSTYFSDLSALGPLKSDSDEWWHLGLAGCSGGSGKDLAVDFYPNRRFSCRAWAAGLLVLLAIFCSCLSTIHRCINKSSWAFF
jgi:hypothetical protein